jgi:hypothetical protein
VFIIKAPWLPLSSAPFVFSHFFSLDTPVSNILTYSITASSQSCADYFTQIFLFYACPNVNSGRSSEAYLIVAP